MNNEFANKVVLVTGATSGIGKAVSERFAAGAARLALVGRNQTALDQVSQNVGASAAETLSIVADVTKTSEVQNTIDQVIDRFGRLDVLINAAGHISSGTIENTLLSAWDAMMDVNLRAVFYLTQLATPHLIKTKGNVVNISSVTGLRSFPGVLAYCVSKAGVDQLTRCAALELAAKGVRVNAVNPGVVVTQIHKRGGMSHDDYERFLEHSRTTHPLGRVGEASEVADLVYYLASDRAAWITGATYSIDGGRALTCAR